MRLVPLAIAAIVAAGCTRDAAPLFNAPPIVSRAVVAGRVTMPNGAGAVAQLVYLMSDFTPTCGPAPQLLGLIRTNGSGAYLFERAVAPDERDGVCVTVVVRPETNTGLAEAQLQGYVSFRLLPPIDTLQLDIALTTN